MLGGGGELRGGKRLVCSPRAMCVCYLCQETYSGTFHDATQEEKVDVFGAHGVGQLPRMIQHLLHGWIAGWRDKEDRDIDKEKHR